MPWYVRGGVRGGCMGGFGALPVNMVIAAGAAERTCLERAAGSSGAMPLHSWGRLGKSAWASSVTCHTSDLTQDGEAEQQHLNT